MLRDVTDRDGRTVIMVTHDPVAAAVADRVVFLADGRIVDELAAPRAQPVSDRMTVAVARVRSAVGDVAFR